MTEMMSSESCRLCSSANDSSHINIFSGIGIEMMMCDILSEHFKREISETDLMPKFVCTSCWRITETFHKLYLKSKSVQEKYLSSLIKVEPDAGDVWQNQKEDSIFCDELQIDVKPETNMDDARSDDFQMDYNGLDGESSDNSENEEHSDEHEDEHGDEHEDEHRDEHREEHKSEQGKRKRKEKQDENVNNEQTKNLKRANNQTSQNVASASKKPPRLTPRKRASLRKQAEFNEFFAQHKHWFDMKCDECTTEFQSYDEARRHYASKHDNPKGYIKCCGSKYMYRSQIKYHLQRHLDPESLTCNQCKKVFPTAYILTRHMAKHDEKQALERITYQCDICRKKFITKQNFIQHMKRHTKEGNSEEKQQQKFIAENFDLKCDFCDTIFLSLHDARDHYKERHNEDRGYIKCCKIKLRTSCMVRDHVEYHLNPDSFKCDICNKQMSNSNILLKHKRKHKSKFICDFCGKVYRNKPSIRMHMFKNHMQLEPKYECTICHKKYKLLNALKSHTYTVHREKQRNLICETCGKSFYVKFHLDRHMLTHIDQSERLVEQIQCEYCGEWLKTKSGIFYHQQIHTSGVQKCEYCQIEVANRVALLGHIRKHHREKKFKCSYCDKGFTIQSLLKSHEEQHTRHNVYPCKFCSRVFTVPSSRQTHTRRNHQDELKQYKEAMKNN